MDEDFVDEYPNDRGFMYLKPTETSYGATVRFSESSSAMDPHIWLWCEQPEPAHPGALKQEFGKVSVHMRLDQAEEIHKRLGFLIEKARKDWGIEGDFEPSEPLRLEDLI